MLLKQPSRNYYAVVVRVRLFSALNENENVEFKRYSTKYLMIQYVLLPKRNIANYGILIILVSLV